jgi:uncharacterized protein YlxP (DUF503 family)
MPIGKLTLDIAIPHAQPLKDRRQVVRSLKDKLRHAFNLSVAELDQEPVLWNRATLGAVAISSSLPYLKGQLTLVDQAARRLLPGLGADLLDSFAEILEGDPSEHTSL